MKAHKIGIAGNLDLVGPPHDRCDILVIQPPTGKRRWWRSPIEALSQGGVKRLGGVAVVWGASTADCMARLPGLPDPVVVVVCSEDAPKGLHDRIEWVLLGKTTSVVVTVESSHGAAEVRVFDLME